MTRTQLINLINWTVDMAADYSLETRIRRLINDHIAVGARPRTLVMNAETWHRLLWEVSETHGYSAGYFWIPEPAFDPSGNGVSSFLGLPILIKGFLPVEEVIVGV